MVNRKILLTVLALAVVLLATPLVSAAAGGNKVSATCLTYYERYGRRWQNPGGITKSGIMHVGEEETYYGVLTIGGTSYDIYSFNIVPAVYNPDTGLYVSKSEAIWYVEPDAPNTPYPDSAFEQPTSNGFAGKVMLMMTNYKPPWTSIMAKAHVLMHGFGSFDGQTLEFSYSGVAVIPVTWEGFCIKG